MNVHTGPTWPVWSNAFPRLAVCPTCQTSVHLLHNEVCLTKAAAQRDIAEFRRLLGEDSYHCPQDLIDLSSLCELRTMATLILRARDSAVRCSVA